MAVRVGLEPTSLCLTGRVSSQLSYRTSNGATNGARTRDLYVGNVAYYQLYHSRMVPVEGFEPPLPEGTSFTDWLQFLHAFTGFGRRERIRTSNLQLQRLLFCQLNYSPKSATFLRLVLSGSILSESLMKVKYFVLISGSVFTMISIAQEPREV